MNTENIIWQGEGLMWKNLAIADNGSEWILSLTNSTSFMKDREMRVTRAVTLDEAIRIIIKEDNNNYDEMFMSGEEG